MAGFDAEKKLLVWQRDGGHCWKCGGSVWEGDVHHRLARKVGGANSRLEWINWAANLLLLHRGCHDWIEANPRLALAAGWMLRAHQDPEDVLVYSEWDGLWYRLHGPEYYKDPLAGLLAPHPEDEPKLWSALAA